MTNRKKPGVVFWATVALVVVVLYIASFGPVCWLSDWLDQEPEWFGSIEIAYYPLLFSAAHCPERVQGALIRYGDPHDGLGTAWLLVNCARKTEQSP